MDDKLNENNTVLQASLINLSSLIQKILEESKKIQEKNITDFYSSNSITLKENSNKKKTKKNIEVNKKITDLKRNDFNKKLNTSPNKTLNDRNFVSNIHINTLANIKGVMTNNNFKNYVGNVIEKSQSTQDEKNSKSNELSEYTEDINKIKEKTKKNNNSNNNNKSLNNFDYKRNTYNEKDKAVNKTNKDDITIKKLKSNKLTKNKHRNHSKKNLTHKDYLGNMTSAEESKIKDEKNNSPNKTNKLSRTGTNNTNNNNNLRKSYQNLNININNNLITKSKANSKPKNKKSLSHYGTKADLGVKAKKNNDINNTNSTNNTNNSNSNKEELVKKLTKKEKSYYILSNSPILRLKERIYFGRSTQNLRNIQSIQEILKKNELFLKDKIKELEGEILECDKRINKVFNASKTAEINFNFILNKDEEEFKGFVLFAENEKEKSEYYSYLKIIYLLFNEKYENIELKNLNVKLYTLVNKKGYKTIKDYLYYLYFKKKDNSIVYNIDKVNAFLEEAQIDKNFNIKFCRFALFTSFLIKEIINYANDIKNIMELKIKTKEFIDVIKNKIKLYNAAYTFKKN